MKNTIIVCLLFCVTYSFSQTFEANLSIKVRANSSGPYGDGCRNDIKVNLVFNDGSKQEIISTKGLNGVGRTNYVTYRGSITFNASKKNATKIETITSRNWKRTIGGCGGKGSFNTSPEQHNVNSICTTNSTDIARWWDVNFTLEILPIVSLNNPSDKTIAQDQPFNIVAPSGFPSAIYNWEYQLGSSTTWLSIPGTSGESTMNKAPEDFLTGTTYIGQNIRFQINSCNENCSNIVSYQITLRSPVLRSFIPIDTKCAYGIDGSFTANFERGLKTGEELLMTLFEIDGSNESLISDKRTTVFDAGNSYSWPDPLPRGNYLIKYQSKLNEVYSSLETSGQFRIGSPDPISFFVPETHIKDVSCNGGSDATIQVHASGGVGNYKYFLDGATTGTPFSNTGEGTVSNPIIQTITGLPAGTKTIKVQDGNGCTERE